MSGPDLLTSRIIGDPHLGQRTLVARGAAGGWGEGRLPALLAEPFGSGLVDLALLRFDQSTDATTPATAPPIRPTKAIRKPLLRSTPPCAEQAPCRPIEDEGHPSAHRAGP
jgi:hypothetical protein